MMHQDTEVRFIDDNVGLGIFATKRIPKGTLLWVLCPLDRYLSGAEIEALPAAQKKLIEHYAFKDVYDQTILCWDAGRYVNHSCEPVMLPVDYGFEIAARDIEVGEEITCDYSELNLEIPLKCACGLPNCRGVIRKDDTSELWKLWDAQVREAVGVAGAVAQPLLAYAKYPNMIRKLIADPASLRSHEDFYKASTPLEALS